MKVIAMIPARMGSQRVKEKNIRLLNKIPLISHIVQSAVESDVFDDIYINSESNVFKDIADYHKVKFYQRPLHLASNSATNDDFVLDFMMNVEGDILIQLLATSPFISSQEIRDFVRQFKEENLETLISVKNEQIECVFRGEAINFNQKGQTLPSQDLEPIQAYACGIMGWSYKRFVSNMTEYNSGYHGGDGLVGYFELKGLSKIDIDTEEDFELAEHIAVSIELRNKKSIVSGIEKSEYSESFVPDILRKDGVVVNEFNLENLPVSNIQEIINRNDNNHSWSHRLINTENNSATLISQMPGEGNRRHYHPNWNEWWYILKGKWIWEIEGSNFEISEGDLVFIEKNKWHKITATGSEPAVRLAVSRADVPHIYEVK